MHADWITPWWQAALLPDKWDVCGVIVPPLSVWHVFALHNIGNPYVAGGPVGKDAAAALLLFASTDYQGGRKLMWCEHYRARRMRWIFRRLRGQATESIHAACVEYVTACLRSASRWERKGSKPCAVPLAWHMVARMSAGDPRKFEFAWNTPYAVGRCVCDAMAEQSGDDSLMQDKAQEMEDNWSVYQKESAG